MTLPPVLTKILQRLGEAGDFSVIVVIMVAVAMMVVPMPPDLVDVLIGVSITLTSLVLMLALNIERPADFATLPSVILLVTVFRMAIEITTSRSILIDADAGEIVNAFGEFVIGGNLPAGIVIFLIITIVQFMVITKGSERVAEVGARFTLDAMPGKQLSIDSDLRSGEITQAEAVRLRRLLAQENQLYGSMDGAMKFVKGDALAGLAIVVVNLVGGIIIGTVQHGLSITEAARTYSLLTVGAGLISQIPALFMSVASGAILTRVPGIDTGNIGGEIVREFARPRALATAAAILLLMTLVPGFPVITFLVLSSLMGGLAFLARRLLKGAPMEAEHALVIPRAGHGRIGPAQASGKSSSGKPTIAVELRLGSGLMAAAGDVPQQLVGIGKTLQRELGIDFPPVHLVEDQALAGWAFTVQIDHLPAYRAEIPEGHVLVKGSLMDVDLLGLPCTQRGGQTASEPQEFWVEAGATETLAKAKLSWQSAGQVVADRVTLTLRRNAAQFFGIQEAKNLLAAMEAASYEDLVREANRAVPLQRFTEIVKRLLEEQVSVSNLRLVLEALVEWGPKEQDPSLLAEYVRASLKRQISHAHADPEKLIAAVLLQREMEDLLRAALRKTAVGTYLTLGDAETRYLLDQIRAKRPVAQVAGPSVVILTSLDIRRFLRGFVVRNDLDIPVLSFQDIAPDYVVRPIATIAVGHPAANPNQPAPAQAVA